MKWFTLLCLALGLAAPAWGFMEGGCGAGKCTDCHNLTVPEASKLLGNEIDKVLSVELAEMPGLWTVEVEKNQKKFPIYIDYSKSYVVSGNIIRLADKKNLTREKMVREQQQEAQKNEQRVDLSKIPLDNALLLGRPEAKTKVIVFTDPQCPYCQRLHGELKKAVAADPDVAFYIKLFPLPMHPASYDISRSILCGKSLSLLDAAFAGKPVPPPLCNSQEVDDNLALVADLGIRSTPTLVFPDGRVVPGYKDADTLLTLLGSDKSVPDEPAAAAAVVKKP